MSSGRNYSQATLAALYSLCNGTCYWPKPACGQPVTIFVNGSPRLNLEIAHIRALNPGGPRYDVRQSPQARNSQANLILLCPAHHGEVDSPSTCTKYPVSLLEEWKQMREASTGTALSHLGELTAESLQAAIAASFTAFDRKLNDALAQFAQFNGEAARMLIELRDQAVDRRHDSLLAAETAEMLSSASRSLEALHLVEAAEMLGTATQSLNALHPAEAAEMLGSAAHSLNALHLAALAEVLSEAAEKLDRATQQAMSIM